MNGFERKANNLWKRGSVYYRLFAKGVTPNNCWLYGAELRQLVDIDAATGTDVYGPEIIEFEVGVVPASLEYIRA